MKRRNLGKAIRFSVLLVFLLQFSLFAEQVRLDKEWKNLKAYKPYPILFLHGFGPGSPKSWKDAVPEIEKYFTTRYYIPEGFEKGYLYNKENPKENPANLYYLEIINFDDRNGSIDTYPPGKTNPQGDNKGWANKVSDAVANLLASDKYGEDPNIDKVLLVAHSMGGLAGREYLRDNEYGSFDPWTGRKVKSLIMTGTPNLGSELAGLANRLSGMRRIRRRIPIFGFIATAWIDLLDEGVSAFKAIEISGEAIKDVRPDSDFMIRLNSYPVQPGDVDYFVIAGKVWWSNGDTVVLVDNQMGKGVLSLKDNVIIDSTHAREPTRIAETNNLLKFLDYTKPVLEITEINDETFDPVNEPDKVFEITTNSVKVEGTLAKEYLPADTKIKYQVYDEYNNLIHEDEIGDVFFPLDISQLSPEEKEEGRIAWFDEDISLPERVLDGEIYRLEMKAVNPGGKESDVKKFYIRMKEEDIDTYVYSDYPDTNYHTSSHFCISPLDPWDINRAFLKVAPNKTLHIYCRFAPGSVKLSVYEVDPDSFDIDTVTWNNQPSVGNLITTFTPVQDKWSEISTGTTGAIAIRATNETGYASARCFWSMNCSDETKRPYLTDDLGLEEYNIELEEGTEEDTGIGY